ncbi:hypothetical protein [Streptomyces chiangmaiensis]|uniref:Transposase n=1 Tax=Streptomyces chiangmaiensis TaxID=766497 RepID=A0ABU7FLI9_9ACTN|nr:hypothetical protein [Streptomyces chiangmaiensis]MED7824975.1 hypothetical protein [Streptomyces chiangmaiensis]
MPRRRKKKRALRPLAAPFTVAAPTGARIRDRLCITTEEAEVLWRVGEHLGHHQRVMAPAQRDDGPPGPVQLGLHRGLLAPP